MSETTLSGLTLFNRGKVRDIYDLGANSCWSPATAISGIDVILPTPIPGEEKSSRSCRNFGSARSATSCQNHLIHDGRRSISCALAGRTGWPSKAAACWSKKVPRRRLSAHRPRLLLSGSGWKDYQKTGTVCGITLPQGLVEAARLDQPIFTPSTKAAVGDHDLNITLAAMIEKVGKVKTEKMRDATIAIYGRARA